MSGAGTSGGVEETQAEAQAQAQAERCAAVMMAGDRASAALGMSVVAVGPGTARVRMRVRADMVNGWGAAHGALVSAVADTAFAVACNSFGEVTVAAGFEVTFLAPAREGDLLEATAGLRSRAGRSGVYDVSVERVATTDEGDDDGRRTVVAELRGRSRGLGRPVEPGARV